MPLFIVFEGLDGVGKSTLIRRIDQLLTAHNKLSVCTSEPFENTNAKTTDDYIADRKNHIEKVIAPYLSGQWKTTPDFLLCDRFVLSTAAYQSTQYVDALRILDLQHEFPIPDLTILLTATIDTLEYRMTTRENSGIPKKGFDSASRAFKDRVQTTYIYLAQDYPNVHIFNTEQPIDSLAESVLTLILSLPQKRNS